MQPTAPCKDCPDRDAVNNCHDRCEKYQAFRAERGKYNLQLAKLKGYNVYLTEKKAKDFDKKLKKKMRGGK